MTSRIDVIGQNGNDGEHYDDRVAFPEHLGKPAAPRLTSNPSVSDHYPESGKQSRYQDAKGEDWIDEFARTATPEEFRGAMRFTIGKYNRRMGKKDELTKEIGKIRDYAERWLEYEHRAAQSGLPDTVAGTGDRGPAEVGAVPPKADNQGPA